MPSPYRFAVILFAALFFTGSGTAGADEVADIQRRIAKVVENAREELEALDELLGAADSRAVQRELRRKSERVDELLAKIPRLSAALERAIIERDGVDTAVSLGGPGGDLVVVVDDHGSPAVVVVEPAPAPAVVIVEPESQDVGPIACPESDFAEVLRVIAAESFSSGKLERLRDATIDRWYSANQVRRMLGEFSFDNDKVEAAVVMHPKVVDMENWFKIHDAFTFDSSKDELRSRVGR